LNKIIDGKKIAEKRLLQLKEKISIHPRKPCLAFILIGEHPPSMSYVKMKQKACEKSGITSRIIRLNENIDEAIVLKEIEKLNKESGVDGILVQFPLPKHISMKKVLLTIDPNKDVDGFCPVNMGRLLIGDPLFIPCTPLGIKNLLLEEEVSVEGKHVVIVGRSQIVGKPLACLLVQKDRGANATVTIAHSRTSNLAEVTKSADILVAAIGHPFFIKENMIKKGTVVIDVGINRVQGKIVGDVCFSEAIDKVKKITPVPGGVGPMTIVSLLENTYQSFLLRNKF
jgi:methylenetetrahydrofolate dehydrogenase (NADP+)/methenyltetrahydrofolate cyclohydrolase